MINKILQKHGGYHNNWYPDVEETPYRDPKIEKCRKQCEGKERELLEKYKKYIPEGWYGFSFGTPTPVEWFSIIDEFLTYLIGLQKLNKISNFEIHQIKMKFGGLRFGVSYKCEDEEVIEHIDLQIEKLEHYLFDEKFIY